MIEWLEIYIVQKKTCSRGMKGMCKFLRHHFRLWRVIVIRSLLVRILFPSRFLTDRSLWGLEPEYNLDINSLILRTHVSIRLFRVGVYSVFGAQMKSELGLVSESEGALIAWKGLLPSVDPDVALQSLQVPEPERKVRFCHLYEFNLRKANNCSRLDFYLVPQIWQG